MMLSKLSTLFLLILCLTGFASHLQATQQTKIKAVAFDFGGVIAQSDRNEVYQFISQSFHISRQEAIEVIAQLKNYPARDEKEQEFWNDYAKSKGIKLPNDWLSQLKEVRFNAIKTIPHMLNLVKNLQRQGYKTALLSNVSKSQAEIKHRLGYYDLFHPAIFSYAIEIRKPDPKAYYYLLDQLKMQPENVLFVDNKLENVKAARDLGIDAILFTNAEELVKELKQRGIEVSLSPQQPSLKN